MLRYEYDARGRRLSLIAVSLVLLLMGCSTEHNPGEPMQDGGSPSFVEAESRSNQSQNRVGQDTSETHLRSPVAEPTEDVDSQTRENDQGVKPSSSKHENGQRSAGDMQVGLVGEVIFEVEKPHGAVRILEAHLDPMERGLAVLTWLGDGVAQPFQVQMYDLDRGRSTYSTQFSQYPGLAWSPSGLLALSLPEQTEIFCSDGTRAGTIPYGDWPEWFSDSTLNLYPSWGTAHIRLYDLQGQELLRVPRDADQMGEPGLLGYGGSKDYIVALHADGVLALFDGKGAERWRLEGQALGFRHRFWVNEAFGIALVTDDRVYRLTLRDGHRVWSHAIGDTAVGEHGAIQLIGSELWVSQPRPEPKVLRFNVDGEYETIPLPRGTVFKGAARDGWTLLAAAVDGRAQIDGCVLLDRNGREIFSAPVTAGDCKLAPSGGLLLSMDDERVRVFALRTDSDRG